MFKFDETATLPTIDIPLLAVVGKCDIATRPFASDRMTKAAPQAELVVLSPGGHLVFMERNEQFTKVIRAFSHDCLRLKRRVLL